MSPLAEWSVRIASRLVPAAYRDEVVADLRAEHRGWLALLVAIVRSGRDARVAMRRARPAESRWRALGADVVGAWRLHRSRPWAALAVIVILALAIGLNTAVYSMVEAVLVRPLPFANSERVVFLWNGSSHLERESLAPARALDIRARVSALERAALIGHMSMTVTGRGPAQRWFGASVSSSFFDVLQSPAAIGRTFATDDPDRDVVVLSHRLWVDEFGADRGVLGQRVVMNGRPRSILGVMPADFFWPSILPQTSAENPPLFWTSAPLPDVPERMLPFDEDITRNRTMGFLRLVARLRPDRSRASTEQELAQVAADLGREFPETDAGRRIDLVPANEQLVGPVAQPMWVVLFASALVVLGASVNVGNLLLVRQAGRRRELAIRSALGAGRWRLTRQLFTEAALLAAAGGVVGALLAMAGLRVLVAMAPESVGRLESASLNAGVLVWTGLATSLTALLLSGLSALAFWRDRSAEDLRGAGTAVRAGGRLRQALVATEVALAMALLVGAMLFGRSLMRLERVDTGLDPDRLLTFDLMLTGERAEYQSKQLEFYDGVVERIRALPGVRAAAGALTLPIGGDDFGASAFPEGRPLPPPNQDRRIGFQIVWDRWFETLGMRILEGRDFGPADVRQSVGVVIINRTLADMEWPGTSPVGQRLKYAREEDAPWLTIVGIVSDVRHAGPGEPPRPEIYLPYRQMTQAMMAVAVRTTGDPLAMVSAVRAAAAAVDASQPISGVGTMTGHLEKSYGRARFLARLTLLFGLATGLLTVVGVYGVTSFAVAQRTKELGVRAALGASPARLGREVLGASLVPVWCGVAAGVALAWYAARLARALLFDTDPSDPAAYAAAIAVLVVTAALASLVPARRAAVVDPVTALRE